MRWLVCILALAACERTREVSIQLGPTADQLTLGFLCRDDAGTLLVERALEGTELVVTIVVDIIDLGGKFPGCRGEELLAACADNSCGVLETANGARYCQTVRFTPGDTQDVATLLPKIRSQLSTPVITDDAPARPALIRAVATHQTCDEALAAFDPAALVGCAYSCPVQLDAVDGPIALSLDALDASCEREVRTCAGFR